MALRPTDRYLIQGLLPRHEVSILAGASGGGKSTIILQFLGMIQRGEPLPGHHDYQPDMRIAYIKTDRQLAELEEWAPHCGCDLAQFTAVNSVIGHHFGPRIRMNPKSILMEMLQAALPCDLIVVDALVALFGDDPRLYNKMFGHLVELADWCLDHHVTIWGTHHAVKARTDFGFKRPQDQISGSGALLGFSSTQMVLTPPEGEIVTHSLHIIPHTAAPEVLSFTRNDHGLFVPWTGDLDNLTTRRVLDAFPDSTQSITRGFLAEIFKEMPPVELDGHLKALLTEGFVSKAPHGRLRCSGN